MNYCKVLYELRTMQKISQRELSEKAELSLPFLGMLERGDREASPKTVGKIAKVFGISVSAMHILALEESESSPEEFIAIKAMQDSVMKSISSK